MLKHILLSLSFTACAIDPNAVTATSAQSESQQLLPNGALCPPPVPQSPYVHLPFDEAPHAAPIEYWAYAGHLAAFDGRRFAFEALFAQFEVAPGQYVRIAQGGLLDRAGQVLHQAGTMPLPGAFEQTTNAYDLSLGEQWSASGGEEQPTILRFDLGDGTAVMLYSSNIKQPLFGGEDGQLAFSGQGQLFEYATVRNIVTGAIWTGGTSRAVLGEGQEVHAWGGFPPISYDRYTIRLTNYEEIVLYNARLLHTSTTLERFGRVVSSNCTTTQLAGSDFSVSEGGAWTSPHSGTVYPTSIQVAVPSKGLHLTLTPTVVDQEVHWDNPFFTPFYVGEMTVSGTRNGAAISGQAFVEMAGR